MYSFRYGGKRGIDYALDVRDELVVVRTRSRRAVATVDWSRAARGLIDQLQPVLAFPDAGVEVRRYGPGIERTLTRHDVRAALQAEPDCQFAGRALCDPKSRAPVVYTENLFVKFEDDCDSAECLELLSGYSLDVKRELPYARNAFFVAAPEGTGRGVFETAGRLLAHEAVELCHPELVREVRRRGAFPQQWHLKRTTIGGKVIDNHANVEAAWALSEGQGTTIAIIDDGVDLTHEEFARPGKIVAPRDVTWRTDDPRPGNADQHGTACAGVACADGLHGASGVAPKVRLLPIRLASGLGSQAEADAFVWAARHGADVISCSWGPADGNWADPADPIHNQVVPLPDSTRLAIDWAVNNGRNGKGCVITWAAGNGNESVDNDGYASYPKVIAVAACSDNGKRSVYSDYGRALWCAFPSSAGVPSDTPGIWTTDRSGTPGYNPGQASRGDVAGNYTNSFGGTSSACPGAAGVAALVIARNPSLRWDQVEDILRRACDRIDPAGGAYDATGFSTQYGYGRLNARTAVELAVAPAPTYTALHRAIQDVPVEDFQTSTLAVGVADEGPVTAARVEVDIEHTYIGDLVVRVLPPAAAGVAPVTLHNRTGGGTDNLKKAFDSVNTPALAALAGKNPQGKWTLEVQDQAQEDTGRIRSFTVELTL